MPRNNRQDEKPTGGKREEKRLERQLRRSRERSVSLDQIDWAQFALAVKAAASIDGALRIGLSRSGTAFAIGVYGDGEPYTDFVEQGEDINEYFSDLQSYLEGLEAD